MPFQLVGYGGKQQQGPNSPNHVRAIKGPPVEKLKCDSDIIVSAAASVSDMVVEVRTYASLILLLTTEKRALQILDMLSYDTKSLLGLQ